MNPRSFDSRQPRAPTADATPDNADAGETEADTAENVGSDKQLAELLQMGYQIEGVQLYCDGTSSMNEIMEKLCGEDEVSSRSILLQSPCTSTTPSRRGPTWS